MFFKKIMMKSPGSTFEDLSDRSTFSSRFRFFSFGSFPMTFGDGLVVGENLQKPWGKKTKMGGSTWFNRNFCSLIFVKTYPMRVPPGGIAGFFWRCKSSVRRSWPKLHKLHLTQIWISDFSKNALFSDKIRWRWRFWSALTFHWPRPWDDTWAVGTGAN